MKKIDFIILCSVIVNYLILIVLNSNNPTTPQPHNPTTIIMDHIIDIHQNVFAIENYEILDPELKSNNIKGLILSQVDIIEHIIYNKLPSIQVQYQNQYVIEYTQMNGNKIKLSPLEPNSVHLLRLIGLNLMPKYSFEFDLKFGKEFILNIMMEINGYMDKQNSPMDYCSVCMNKLKLKGIDKISCCEKEFCSIKSKHLVMNNMITDQYKKDPYLCSILIDILIEGTTHPKEEKIFKPLPKMVNVSNLAELKTIIKNEKTNLNIVNIAQSSNDIELHRKIGNIAYSIISNAISDNYFSLSTIEKFKIDVLNGSIPNSLESAFDSPNVKFIGLNYSYEVESKFPREYFLFHGSPIQSWYPIVKNGLKVMSGTEFMTNGAAYGNGIYLSDQFSMSLGYSARNSTIYSKIRNIVGVFEILGGIEQHKKTESIFVVSDDKIMLLRYLIVTEGNISSSFYKQLSDYFVKYLGSINKLSDKKSVSIKNKRLCAEMKLLNSNSKVSNTQILSELSNWKIELNDINGKKISLNVYFNDYPKSPPKILLECETNLEIKKSICDNESNIIIQEINPSKWEVTTNLSKIVDIIHNCLISSM